MRKVISEKKTFILVVIALLIPLTFASVAFLISCGGGGGGGGGSSGDATTGTVRTYITDPPLCKEPNGTLQHVYVTITRVTAHKSSDVGPDDNGWVDLVDLRTNPKQIDLLSLDNDQCLLIGELGSTTGIPAGKYQQIRLYLLSNDAPVEPANDACEGHGFNCVVDGSGIHTLNLSSQAQTGLKIPPGQIAGGGLTVEAGQVVDLAIDFDACSSIVLQGDGEYRLKPTLRAGEISIIKNIIIGRVVEVVNTIKNPIPNAYVFIENDEDGDGIDRVVAQSYTDAEGRFAFCNLPAGNYDIVVAATNGTTYNATVTLGVTNIGIATTDIGDIPLVPEVGGPAEIRGMVTTKTGTTPTPADVEIVALQAVNSTLKVTIPLFGMQSPFVKITTAAAPSSGGTCPSQTDCEVYSLFVPASYPQVGTFNGPGYAPFGSGGVKYSVNARAFELGSTDPFCGLSSQEKTGITVTADTFVNAPVINFVCPGP